MKKIVIVIIFALSTLYGWEINTHRAIDKTAIESENIAASGDKRYITVVTLCMYYI